MNALLWIVQIALGLLSLAGGGYKLFAYAQLSQMPATAALSRPAWGAVGVFEMLCAVLLIMPAAIRWMPTLTPAAAVALALESIALAVLYARYSVRLDAANPLIWVVLMAIMAAFVAYGRFAR